MKKLLNIFIWTVLITALLIFLGFSSARHKRLICKDFKISIDYNDADTFLRIKNIEKQILSSGDPISGKKLKEINTGDIELSLRKNPYLKDADVFSTVEGNIKVNIKQRVPIVRIINKYGKGYYIDSEGILMPLSRTSTTRVLIASGNITDSYSASINLAKDPADHLSGDDESANLKNIYLLSDYINKDNFLRSMIDQIYININNEIEMIPKIGDQLIIFGNTNDMEEKFDKLIALYKDGFSKTGWNKYKTINLKYKNQVVCSKK